MIGRKSLPSLALLLLIFPACATHPRAQAPARGAGPAPACRDASEYLPATLWVQTSPEYRVVAETAYRFASRALDEALKDRGRSAALEQTVGFSDLPPAVVMDVDETVLDNSPCQARMALEGTGYEPKLWSEWVARASARPVPGALDFVRHARRALASRSPSSPTGLRGSVPRHARTFFLRVFRCTKSRIHSC